MKQVILSKPRQQFVEIQDVDECKYYGVCSPEDGLPGRGFITRVGYEAGSFRVLANDGVTRGNGWSGTLPPKPAFTTLDGTIMDMVSRGKNVYEFDTARELFSWVAADPDLDDSE